MHDTGLEEEAGGGSLAGRTSHGTRGHRHQGVLRGGVVVVSDGRWEQQPPSLVAAPLFPRSRSVVGHGWDDDVGVRGLHARQFQSLAPPASSSSFSTAADSLHYQASGHRLDDAAAATATITPPPSAPASITLPFASPPEDVHAIGSH